MTTTPNLFDTKPLASSLSFQYYEYANMVNENSEKIGNPGTPNSVGTDDDPDLNMEKLEKEANEVS